VPTSPIAIVADAPAAEVAEGMATIRAELEVPVGFPTEVTAAAAAVAAAASVDPAGGGRADRTGVELVTIDPPGSRDLDQAYGAERLPGGGTRVWYAIADVAAFVTPADPVDAEAQRRGVTFYGPDHRVPLHPPELSEGAASLLPDGERPALLWCIDLDGEGAPVATRLERAIVRSQAQLTYAEVTEAVAAGTADAALVLLREIGEQRLAAEVARGGVSLPLPDQVVAPAPGPGGDLRLEFDGPVAAEGWNAQVSLLAGLEAARIMVEGGTGILRTLPPADERTVARLRRSAAALGVAWPDAGGYPAFVRSLDPASPVGASLLVQASRALRGAGYVGFADGAVPAEHEHSAVAAPYAHVTAPLRRLGDRFAAEAALAVATQVDVPDWVLAALPALPDLLNAANQREAQISRAVVDLAEAVVLGSRIGHELDAVVVTREERGCGLQVLEPPVRARTDAALELGAEVRVKVDWADPVARRVGLVPI
jgi:exoribonuclease R